LPALRAQIPQVLLRATREGAAGWLLPQTRCYERTFMPKIETERRVVPKLHTPATAEVRS